MINSKVVTLGAVSDSIDLQCENCQLVICECGHVYNNWPLPKVEKLIATLRTSRYNVKAREDILTEGIVQGDIKLVDTRTLAQKQPVSTTLKKELTDLGADWKTLKVAIGGTCIKPGMAFPDLEEHGNACRSHTTTEDGVVFKYRDVFDITRTDHPSFINPIDVLHHREMWTGEDVVKLATVHGNGNPFVTQTELIRNAIVMMETPYRYGTFGNGPTNFHANDADRTYTMVEIGGVAKIQVVYHDLEDNFHRWKK